MNVRFGLHTKYTTCVRSLCNLVQGFVFFFLNYLRLIYIFGSIIFVIKNHSELTVWMSKLWNLMRNYSSFSRQSYGPSGFLRVFKRVVTYFFTIIFHHFQEKLQTIGMRNTVSWTRTFEKKIIQQLSHKRFKFFFFYKFLQYLLQ